MDHQGRLPIGEEKEMVKQQQRRAKPPENNNLQVQVQQNQQNQQHPQKCPRCDSLNTKFCYYNNYSLSQPRYFCKACRRYWTQGGTLRNVPVGGGCRKGKRNKASSSGVSENSRSQSSQPLPPPPHELQLPQNLATKDLGNLGLPPMNLPYYSSGGFLSSLAAMQSFSQQQQMPFNPPPNMGGQFGSSSNLGLLQGLNLPSFSLQQQHAQNQHQNEIYQMGTQSLMQQPNRALGPWDPSIINTSTSSNPNASNPSGSTSLNQNHQWPHLP